MSGIDLILEKSFRPIGKLHSPLMVGLLLLLLFHHKHKNLRLTFTLCFLLMLIYPSPEMWTKMQIF